MPELIVIAMAAILLVVPLAFGVGLAIYLVRRNQAPPTPLPPPPPENPPS
jgi:hypothetical protein